MKTIHYNLCVGKANNGTVESPDYQETFSAVKMPYTDENLIVAQREAHNGEYTIEDDGQPDPVAPEFDTATWDELAAAISEGVDDV